MTIAHNALTRAVRHAEANRHVVHNVAALVDTPQGQPGRPSRALTAGQAAAVLKAAGESRLGAYVVLCLMTGIRTEEAPDVVVVVGPAAATGEWDAASRLDPSALAPAIASTGTRSLPLSLGLGAMLLDQAEYRGHRRLQGVGQDEPAAACVTLGGALSDSDVRMGLLVMGDGSARRSQKAPGFLDPRAMDFDAEVERAVRAGDLDALQGLDQALAGDLMVTGRAAWQVMSGAMSSQAPGAEVLYCDDPFGVFYLVAHLRPHLSRAADHSS